MLRLCVLGSLASVSACGSGEVRETVFSIEGFCGLSPQLAIIAEVDAASNTKIDRVTAKHNREELCFLERTARDSADDAGEPDAAIYSCLAQGQGSYEVRVTSGKRTWTQTVDVSGDECHVAALKTLSFRLD